MTSSSIRLESISDTNVSNGADGPKLDEERCGLCAKEKLMQVTSSSGEVGRIENFEEDPNPIPDTPSTPASTYPTFSIHVIALLMSSSVLGTLARLGIHALAAYPEQSIFPLAWVQAVGCVIMGFALAMREPITKFYGPLYTGVTTGFCGSLTTFSSWQLDVFVAFARGSGLPELWIYHIMDGLTRLLFTMAVSMSSFCLGVHLGERVLALLPESRPATPIARWLFTSLSIVIYVLTIPLFVRLDPSWRSLATAALLFSFPGTLSRYILSTQLNPRIKLFPVGTLIANEVATAILVACHIIQRTPNSPSPVACSILQGFIDGFCGCLSTVSSFIAEVRLLKGRKAWFYVVASLGIGQVLCLVLLGPVWWSGRIQENSCTAS